MKRLILSALIFGLFLSPAYASGWGVGEPAGTQNVSDIDTYVGYNNTALDRMLSRYREGMKLSYASAATVSVGVGEVMVSNAAGTVRIMLKNTSATTLTWAGAGSGDDGLDTGSEATGTTYYVYAVASATSDTSATFVISANSATPTGETYYKRLGSFYNDGSSNITYDKITNDDNYYAKEFGDYESKTVNTAYQATTDGIVVAHLTASASGAKGTVTGYTDSSSSPTTVVGVDSASEASGNTTAGISFPVKRGDYYKATFTITGSVSRSFYWIPLE